MKRSIRLSAALTMDHNPHTIKTTTTNPDNPERNITHGWHTHHPILHIPLQADRN
nr:MAG TPA: hypothetical protein [Caudoviricetes sp.]